MTHITKHCKVCEQEKPWNPEAPRETRENGWVGKTCYECYAEYRSKSRRRTGGVTAVEAARRNALLTPEMVASNAAFVARFKAKLEAHKVPLVKADQSK